MPNGLTIRARLEAAGGGVDLPPPERARMREPIVLDTNFLSRLLRSNSDPRVVAWP